MQLYISYVSSKAERQTYVSPSTTTICTINTTLLILIRGRNCPLHLYASASFHFSNPPQHCLIISPSPSSTLSTSPACHFHVAPSPLHPCHISSSHEDLTIGEGISQRCSSRALPSMSNWHVGNKSRRGQGNLRALLSVSNWHYGELLHPKFP